MKRMITKLRNELLDELTHDILPFWMKEMLSEEGDFYCGISADNQKVRDEAISSIMVARILWTFSASYRILHDESYLAMAKKAKQYIVDYFYDKENSGVYWSIGFDKKVIDDKKQIYANAFTIYGLSEYYRATGDCDALKLAVKLYHNIEKYSFDEDCNGYFEAFTVDWQPIQDMRLSDKDMNEPKTMNTHLHILEAYTNLYRVWKDETLKKKLVNLIYIFKDIIIDDETKHLKLFFDENWHSSNNIVSYGHDIESSWLLYEACLVVKNSGLIADIEPYIIEIADAATEGFLPEAGMIYEMHLNNHSIDADRHWWVQAEAVIGFLNIYQSFGDEGSLEKATQCWTYIKDNLIDRTNGEWYWSIKSDGSVNSTEPKAGFWKCPYHNGRMCLEVIERIKDKCD